MRLILRTILLLTLAITVPTGCAAVVAALPGIIAAVVDGMQVLDAIEAFVARFFASKPDAATQAKIQAALDKCRSALNVALRVAQGTDAASNAKTDAAFDEFKRAYLELLALVRPFGVQQASGALRAEVSPAGDHLTVPEPLALAPRKAGSK